MTTLLKRGFFEIVAQQRVVCCIVINREDVVPSEGAEAAREMQIYLLEHLATTGSPYLGLVMDVRLGPTVFGPETRDALGTLFSALERHEKRVAALVGDSSMQQLQFTSLCREKAPRLGTVVQDPDAATRWVELGGAEHAAPAGQDWPRRSWRPLDGE